MSLRDWQQTGVVGRLPWLNFHTKSSEKGPRARPDTCSRVHSHPVFRASRRREERGSACQCLEGRPHGAGRVLVSVRSAGILTVSASGRDADLTLIHSSHDTTLGKHQEAFADGGVGRQQQPSQGAER